MFVPYFVENVVERMSEQHWAPTDQSAADDDDEEQAARMASWRTSGAALSLSGCGFLGSYHFGSVACLRSHAPSFVGRLRGVAGASAGALVASLLVVCPNTLQECLSQMYGLVDELNGLKLGALTPGFSLVRRLETMLDGHLPADAHRLADGRLHVSLTRLSDRANCVASAFPTRDCLLRHLVASCFIPVYMGVKERPPVIDGVEYGDGGLSNNLPKLASLRTVTVSPFSGEAEISPADAPPMFDWTMTLANQSMKVNLKNIVRGAQALFPPKRAVLEQYYDMGYRDTMRFLLDNDCVERRHGSEV